MSTLLGTKVFAVSPVQLPYNDSGGTACSITSAQFDPGQSPNDTFLNPLKPSDTTTYSYYKAFYATTNRQTITITIATSGCSNVPIYVNLLGQHSLAFQDPVYALVSPLENKKFIVPPSNQLTISMRPGESKCLATLPTSSGPDCAYFLEAGTSPIDSSLKESNDPLNEYSASNLNKSGYFSFNQIKGKLAYDQDSKFFLDSWSELSDNSLNPDNGVPLVPNGSAAINPNNTIYSGLSDALSAIGVKVNTITSAGDLGTFINAIIAFITAIMGVIAVIMIMYEGFVYMRSDNVDFKTRTRGNIVKVVLGFLLLLSTYVILKTINPDLLNLVPNLPQLSLLSESQYKAITGQSIPTTKQLNTDVTSAATADGVDPCALQAILKHESGGNANAIADDGNVWSIQNIPSRKAFVLSGKKYSGATFTPDINSYGDKNLLNDDSPSKIDTSDPNLKGLDWRFSQGIGALQITFFPANWGANYTPTFDQKDTPPKPFTVPGDSHQYTPAELLNYNTNIKVGGELFAADLKKCNGDIAKAFGAYNSGQCVDVSASNYSGSLMATYNQCKNGTSS